MPSSPRGVVSFTYNNIPFTVQKEVGGYVYRDSNHLGGPWSSAQLTLNNPSIAAQFRRKLRAAILTLEAGPQQ